MVPRPPDWRRAHRSTGNEIQEVVEHGNRQHIVWRSLSICLRGTSPGSDQLEVM